MQMVLIPSGEFRIGSNHGYGNERPVHTVRLSRPFYLGIFPVTQPQWQAVMGRNPSRFQGDDRSVEQVSWEEAQEFVRLLNTRERVTGYRLPTEAEWEYATRAGSRARPPPTTGLGAVSTMTIDAGSTPSAFSARSMRLT